MGIEQSDNEKKYSDRKKEQQQKASLDFFEVKKLSRDTSKLLQTLSRQISQEFGIDINEVKNLISSNTSGSLDDLKSALSWNEKINFSDLQRAIDSAKNKIEELVKNEIENLKNSLSTYIYVPETHSYFTTKKFIPQGVLQKAYEPQNFWDQLVWVTIGIIDSGEAVILYSYELWKWILASPYHLYLILTWKWLFKWFKDI